jgi:choline dehydrogenase-like flavoprotein
MHTPLYSYHLFTPCLRVVSVLSLFFLSSVSHRLRYMFNQSGPLSMAPSQLGAFVKSTPDVASPDLQYHVQVTLCA